VVAYESRNRVVLKVGFPGYKYNPLPFLRLIWLARFRIRVSYLWSPLAVAASQREITPFIAFLYPFFLEIEPRFASLAERFDQNTNTHNQTKSFYINRRCLVVSLSPLQVTVHVARP